MTHASWHETTIPLSGDADIEYQLEISYENDAGSLGDWRLLRIEAWEDGHKPVIYTRSQIESGRFGIPKLLQSKYRTQIEELILLQMWEENPRHD